MTAPDQPRAPLSLVLIDDDEIDRSAVRRALHSESGAYTIEEFDSGESGLARLLGDATDCVLLDYSLPGADGFEILARLHAAGVETPVIMLTGMGDEQLVIESLRRGAYDYLPKAKLDGETLAAKIRSARSLFEARQRARVAETELHDLVERLRRAVAARESVLAVVSHDLRGPLNNIELAMGLLELPDNEPQRALAIASVRRAVARADRLIDDLLDVTQIGSGALEIVKRPVAVAPLIETAVADVHPLLTKTNVSIELRLDAEPGPIFADRDRIIQVLDNLLRNAIKYGPCGGVIVIEARQRDDCVEFVVSDQGPGLSKGERAHVFDRYWRAQERSTSSGSGLGLAIAKGIVDEHGGEIGVESPAAGGARFFFTIPLALGTGRASDPG